MQVVLFVKAYTAVQNKTEIESLGYVVENFDDEFSIVYYPWPEGMGFTSFPWFLSGGSYLHKNLTILFKPNSGWQYFNEQGVLIRFEDGDELTSKIVYTRRDGACRIEKCRVDRSDILVRTGHVEGISFSGRVFSVFVDVLPLDCFSNFSLPPTV